MKKIFTLFIMLFGLMSSIAAKEITIYFINNLEWENINAYVWSDKTGEVLPWPGEPVKDTGLTYRVLLGIKGYEYEYKIYSYTFDYNKAQNIIFNFKPEYDSKYYQTEDLKVNPEMSLIYNLKWFDGITYEYNSDKTAKLVEFDRDYNRNLEELSEILPNITSIEIPTTVQHNDTSYNVTSIGEEAFYGCSGVTSITIPNSVTSIGNYAFSSCRSLTSVTIPNSVTSIGEFAFYRCSGVTSITIPNSVTSIGEFAFYGTGIYNNNSNWDNGVLYIDNCLINAKSDVVKGSYTIKEGTRVIGGKAFYNCSELTSVTIPNSVTSIGEKAFDNCSLKEITVLPTTVPKVDESAFGVHVVTFYITLYVPCDAYDEYVKNNVFGKFDNIKCISNDKPEENPTSIYETIIDANITISGGTISADTEFHIYNSIGQDVTSLNGNLVPGIYLVQIGEDRVKVMLK